MSNNKLLRVILLVLILIGLGFLVRAILGNRDELADKLSS